MNTTFILKLSSSVKSLIQQRFLYLLYASEIHFTISETIKTPSWQAIFFWTLVVRHLGRCFEKSPHLKPPPTPLDETLDIANVKAGTGLSSAQAAQIAEIFNLFDTDGTGSIDKREIQFALSALGFQTQEDEGKSQEEMETLDAIMGDGTATLEEFSALMTGEIGGHNPYEEARSAFALLSRPDGDRKYDGLITLSKLEAVCLEYQVVYCI